MKIFQVDAFSSRPFAGNPAAVCIVTEPIEASLMQQIAIEMNLSETAFVQAREDGYDLRWFTPAYEVDLCGHATLAAAHVLWETALLDLGHEAYFYTRSGLLKARKLNDRIELNFPSQPAREAEAPAHLIESLGVTPVFTGYNDSDFLIVVEDDTLVKEMQPNFRRMAQVDMRGVIVTAQSTSPEFDFISRFFAPSAGIDEDPVTGSAHCCLGPYWAKRLQKSKMRALQASARSGVVGVTISGNRVLLKGKAVTILVGNLKL